MHLQGGAVYVPQYLVDYGSGSTLGQKNNTVGINCHNLDGKPSDRQTATLNYHQLTSNRQAISEPDRGPAVLPTHPSPSCRGTRRPGGVLRCSFCCLALCVVCHFLSDRKRGKSNLRFFGVGHSVQVAVLNAGVVLVVVCSCWCNHSCFR